MLYFDHTATGLIDREVVDFYAEQLIRNNYNPAARYPAAFEAAESIRESKRQMAEILSCQPEELLITSGATESINTALKGIAYAPNPKNRRILTSPLEHPATNASLRFLVDQLDYQVDYLKVDSQGKVDLEHLAACLRQNSYDLLTIIQVNNVLGSVNPIEEIVKLKNQIQPGLPIHIDAVQSLGKIPLCLNQLGPNLASFSLHKIGSPKGIGLLYLARGTRIESLIHGGGQQSGLRSGTENPALVATAAFCLKRLAQNFERDLATVTQLKSYLLNRLGAAKVNYTLLSPEDGVPHILSICFPGLRAESLLNVLASWGIALSIGSACSSKKSEQNPVLKALKLPSQMDRHILRISLDPTNSEEEIDELVQKISQALAKYAL